MNIESNTYNFPARIWSSPNEPGEWPNEAGSYLGNFSYQLELFAETLHLQLMFMSLSFDRHFVPFFSLSSLQTKALGKGYTCTLNYFRNNTKQTHKFNDTSNAIDRFFFYNFKTTH